MRPALIFPARPRKPMLTRRRLMVGPWQPDVAEGARRVRPVRDSATGAALGVVRWAPVERKRWWHFWSSATALEICETDDRALVMSVRPSRISKGAWVVLDCDGNEVGKLRGDDVLDPWGNAFARRACDSSGTWTLRELDGRGYATCSMAPGGDDAIDFLEPALTNPFLRMLVIGSFLLLRPAK
jgi:hypothetical protein